MSDKIVSKYIPEFYEREYGETNVVGVSGVIADKAISEIDTIGMNDYTNLADMIREFKIDEVIASGFKIRETAFLKSFFAFKGTDSDLEYIINNIGYDSEIYVDGTISHIDLDGNETVAPTTQFVIDTGGKERSAPCEMSILVQLNLNDPAYEGYNSGIISKIRKTIEDRISLCTYISQISVRILAVDTFETLDLVDVESFFGLVTRPTDELIREYYKAPLVYGQPGLTYGGYKEIYGRHLFPFLAYLDEELEVTRFRDGEATIV